MIPMRIRMFFFAAIYNLFSYTFQILESIYQIFAEMILDLLTEMSEGLYSFFYSHHEAFRAKIQDKTSRTSYIRDGYGRRYKVVSPATKKFYAVNYIPILRRRLR